jgi:ubiquinone/menaquinone biosynthesis C-methylase UbiE
MEEPRPSFETRYREGTTPWDIGRPQPVVRRLLEEGHFRGDILDAGCGTGENALLLASRGHSVFGLDFSPTAVERAREKGRDRALNATFWVGNALQLVSLNRTFDTVLDSALFHAFNDSERTLYAENLRHVLKPGGRLCLVCFSEKEPPGWGPRRVTRAEILGTFREGFRSLSIREEGYSTTQTKEPVKAWLSVFLRT